MSNYTETFSNSPTDTILGAEFQTEFDAIKTAIATKAAGNAFQNADGSTLTSIATAWATDAQATRTAGLTLGVVTLATLGAGGGTISINCALGNVFIQPFSLTSTSDPITMNDPTNGIAGTEIYLILKRTGGSDPDLMTQLVSGGAATHIKYSSTSPGGTGRTAGGPSSMGGVYYNLYYMFYNGTNWYMNAMVESAGLI